MSSNNGQISIESGKQTAFLSVILPLFQNMKVNLTVEDKHEIFC